MELLKELQASGKLTRKSKWKEAVEEVRDDKRYKALRKLSKEAPEGTFDKHMEATQKLFLAQMASAKALATRCAGLTSGIEYNAFVSVLKAQEAKEVRQAEREAVADKAEAADSETLAAMRAELREALAAVAALREEEVAMAKEAEEEEEEEEVKAPAPVPKMKEMAEEALTAAYTTVAERLRAAEEEGKKRKLRSRKKFRDLLESVRDMALSGTSFSEWSKVRDILSSDPAFSQLEDEAEREELWNEFVRDLTAEKNDHLHKVPANPMLLPAQPWCRVCIQSST